MRSLKSISNAKLLNIYRRIHSTDTAENQELMRRLYNLLFERDSASFFMTQEYEVKNVFQDEILKRLKSGEITVKEPEKSCGTCKYVMQSNYSRECARCVFGFEGWERDDGATLQRML